MAASSKTFTSIIWNFFEIQEDQSKAKCKLCNKIIGRGGSETSKKNYTTSSLRKHAINQHPNEFNEAEKERKAKEQKRIDSKRKSEIEPCSSKSLKTLDIKDDRSKKRHYLIAEMMKIDIQPFSIVEDTGFQRLMEDNTEPTTVYYEEGLQSKDSVQAEEQPKATNESRAMVSSTFDCSQIGTSHESSNQNIANLNHNNSQSREDEYDAIGRNVAAKLRRLPNRTRIIAEKFIGEVLFRAEMGTLHLGTSISLSYSENEPPPPPPSNQGRNIREKTRVQGLRDGSALELEQDQIFVKEEEDTDLYLP